MRGSFPVRRLCTLSQLYSRRVQDGVLRDDAQQRAVVGELDKTLRHVWRYVADVDERRFAEGVTALQPPALPATGVDSRGQLVVDASVAAQNQPPLVAPSLPPVRVPRGVYLHGSVGTGKTMVMDLFRDAVTAALPAHAAAAHTAAKSVLISSHGQPHGDVEALASTSVTRRPGFVRRVHFHKFMLDVHCRVREWKQRLPSLLPHLITTSGSDGRGGQGSSGRAALLAPERDALTHVANDIADSVTVLCFDEFQVRVVARCAAAIAFPPSCRGMSKLCHGCVLRLVSVPGDGHRRRDLADQVVWSTVPARRHRHRDVKHAAR